MRRSTEPSRAEVTSLLGAFCFFLSAIEYMVPKPLPFMRLGIANLPILLAVDILPFPWFITLALVKVVGMSLISGSLFSFVAIFSLAGTLAAALAMWVAARAGPKLISPIGVSILGAMASNAVQVVLARYIVFGQAAWLIAPLFLGIGLVTGTALGIFADHFARTSCWYAHAAGLAQPLSVAAAEVPAPIRAAAPAELPEASAAAKAKFAARRATRAAASARRAARRTRFEGAFSPAAMALAGALAALIYLFEENLAVKAALFALFALAAIAAGKRVSFLMTAIVSAGIIATNLLVPTGRVLARIGPLAITQFALIEGISKALTFEGLMLLSKATILQGLRLPGRFGRIVASAFVYYDRIVEYKGKIRASRLSEDADVMMCSIWDAETNPTSTPSRAGGIEPRGLDQAVSGSAWKGALPLAIVIVAIGAVSIIL